MPRRGGGFRRGGFRPGGFRHRRPGPYYGGGFWPWPWYGAATLPLTMDLYGWDGDEADEAELAEIERRRRKLRRRLGLDRR